MRLPFQPVTTREKKEFIPEFGFEWTIGEEHTIKGTEDPSLRKFNIIVPTRIIAVKLEEGLPPGYFAYPSKPKALIEDVHFKRTQVVSIHGYEGTLANTVDLRNKEGFKANFFNGWRHTETIYAVTKSYVNLPTAKITYKYFRKQRIRDIYENEDPTQVNRPGRPNSQSGLYFVLPPVQNELKYYDYDDQKDSYNLVKVDREGDNEDAIRYGILGPPAIRAQLEAETNLESTSLLSAVRDDLPPGSKIYTYIKFDPNTGIKFEMIRNKRVKGYWLERMPNIGEDPMTLVFAEAKFPEELIRSGYMLIEVTDPNHPEGAFFDMIVRGASFPYQYAQMELLEMVDYGYEFHDDDPPWKSPLPDPTPANPKPELPPDTVLVPGPDPIPDRWLYPPLAPDGTTNFPQIQIPKPRYLPTTSPGPEPDNLRTEDGEARQTSRFDVSIWDEMPTKTLLEDLENYGSPLEGQPGIIAIEQGVSLVTSLDEYYADPPLEPDPLEAPEFVLPPVEEDRSYIDDR